MKKITFILASLLVNMMLLAQNQAPVAVNDTVEPVFGQEFTVNVISNDYDPDGDSFGIAETSMSFLLSRPEVIAVSDSSITFLLGYHYQDFAFFYYLEDENGNIDYTLSFGKVVFPVIENEKYIDINNIKAMIHSIGNHFWDFEQSRFYFPKNTLKTAVFCNSLWMGGLDDQGDVHLAAETYRQTGTDYWEGPLSQGEEIMIEPYIVSNWCKIWKINKEEVLYHKEHWNDPDYEMPEAIATWPAHGDTSLHQAEFIAPFVNVAGDEHYQPELGDYPLIKGDQTLFFVFNDLLHHSESGGDSLGVEIHAMFWAIHDETKPWYENTIFMHYEIFNRSGNDYSDMFLGLFTDTDIGNVFDDFVQSDVQRGTFITYNGDEDDNGVPESYGINPPAVGIVILGGPKMDEDDTDNPNGQCDESINGVGFGDGIVDNERLGMSSFVFFDNGGGSVIGDPTNPEQYYSYLQGKWRDGSPMFYGGNGYGAGIAQPPVECKFMYPGDSDPCYWGTSGIIPDYGNWTEEEAGNNPDDRRGLQTTGPFTFESGSMEVLDVAYVCAWDSVNPYPASVDLLKVYIDSLRADYMANADDFGYDPALGVESFRAEKRPLTLFPNPARDAVGIQLPVSIDKGFIEVYDVSGSLIKKEAFSAGSIYQLDAGDLLPGFYTLRIESQKGTFVGKFVKQ